MKNDTASIADRLAEARERERRACLIVAKKASPTGRMMLRRAMARVEQLILQAVLAAQEARRAAMAAELVGKLDSDLVAALHAMRREGR